jgi:sugar lactone lactonase YvrE
MNEKDCNVNVICNVVPFSGGGRTVRQLRPCPRVPNGFVLQEEDSTVEAEEKALRVLCGSHH